MTAATYDVVLSHAWADGDRPQQIADALTQAGLRVWFDAAEIDDFASITRAVTEGLAQSKALVAYYSKTYPLRRACQWELTAAFLAAQTEGDPRRRVLVINPEKKTPETPDSAAHIHPIELRDEKFLTAPNGNGDMQKLVQSIVQQVGTLDGLLADIHPLTAPNWYGMTPVGSTRFVGRLAEMWEVHSLLHRTDVAQITGATVNVGQVSGLGGVGKSLLAEEYGLHFGAAYPGGVFWLRAYGNDDSKAVLGAQERETLRADQMHAMAEELHIKTEGLTPAQIKAELQRAIEGRGKACLWVVDDVPNGLNGEALRGWFAPHALARTLITTRSREYGSLAEGIDLSVLAPEEAYQLLTSRKPPLGEAEQAQARALAEDLGCHALALDVTAAAVSSYGGATPFGSFRSQLARADKDALELAKDLADALPNGHEASIAQTMLGSIRKLGAEGQDFLRLASVLAVAPIPASLVSSVFTSIDSLSHEDAEWRQAQAFDQVKRASLAEVSGEKQDARSVHTLVSRAVRFHEKASAGRTEALRSAAVEALRAEIAKAAKDPRLHKQIESHVAHARQVVSTRAYANEANLVDWVALYDYFRGAYASARILYERQLEFHRREQGSEHPDTLTSMRNLATTLWSQGDLPGARRFEEEILAIRRRVLGPEHRETLTVMNNLAETLAAQGDLAGARRLHEEELNVCRRVMGPEHPDTLVSMSNLASTLRAQGDLAGARTLKEETLAIRRRVLGPEHPSTSVSAWWVCLTLQELGEHAAARAVLERDLLWLLDRDPATLGADQRKAREYVAGEVKKSG